RSSTGSPKASTQRTSKTLGRYWRCWRNATLADTHSHPVLTGPELVTPLASPCAMACSCRALAPDRLNSQEPENPPGAPSSTDESPTRAADVVRGPRAIAYRGRGYLMTARRKNLAEQCTLRPNVGKVAETLCSTTCF